MADIFDISASVSADTIAGFSRALDRYREDLGNSQAVAVRRGTIALVKSLRARTPRAKKIVPMRDVSPYDGEGPKYITANGATLRRYAIKRRGGVDARTYVYPAANKSEARNRGGRYIRWGLAKKSWGWFMHSLFGRANPEGGNSKAVVDSRMTEGHMREVVSGPNPRVEVLIVNKLGYMREILPDSALEDAMASATRSINAQIDKGLAKARENLV